MIARQRRGLAGAVVPRYGSCVGGTVLFFKTGGRRMRRSVQQPPNFSLPRTAGGIDEASRQMAATRSGVPTEVFWRIAEALERLAPAPPAAPDFAAADAFIWHPDQRKLAPVPRDNRLENTERFARSLPANNALLWGARGMGKSSLVKAAHAAVNAALASKDGTTGSTMRLILVEIHREDIESLPDLMSLLRSAPYRFLVSCDDLSFEAEDTSYKSLNAVFEGGIEGRPANVILYATSNRRHLMSRDMIENERASAINPGEAVEEKVSLSDRFGLWLGFHRCSQDEFLAMVEGYVRHYGVPVEAEALRREALEWATTRGARSGRVAWQYVQDVAGRLGVKLADP